MVAATLRYEYVNLVFLAELLLWQNETYDTEQFLDNLQKKTRYYYRAKRIQEKQLQVTKR